jgi:hypothetical protein
MFHTCQLYYVLYTCTFLFSFQTYHSYVYLINCSVHTVHEYLLNWTPNGLNNCHCYVRHLKNTTRPPESWYGYLIFMKLNWHGSASVRHGSVRVRHGAACRAAVRRPRVRISARQPSGGPLPELAAMKKLKLERNSANVMNISCMFISLSPTNLEVYGQCGSNPPPSPSLSCLEMKCPALGMYWFPKCLKMN